MSRERIDGAGRLRLTLLGLWTLGAAGLAPACGDTPALVVPDWDSTAPDDMVAAYLTPDVGLPAVAVAVVDGGRTIYSRVAGVRRRGVATQVTDLDTFHVGSNTKAMTALVAGTVVDAGMLGWDTSVGDVLAGVVPVGAYGGVTLAQLLSHTSGMPELPGPSEAEFSLSTAPAGTQRRQIAALALAADPVSAPGTAFRYSNVNFVVAGLMLEIATATSWEAMVTERLFTPLGMTSAGFGPPATPGTTDEPWGHDPAPVPPDSDIPPGFGPAGVVHANLPDLVAYVHLYMDHGMGPAGPILSEAALAEIERPRLHDYALGWFSGHTDGEATLWHNGSNMNFYSSITVFPDRKAAVIVLANRGDLAAWNLVDSLGAYFKYHFGLPLAPAGSIF